MRIKEELVISGRRLPKYRQLFGAEAEVALKDSGLSFLHVDDDGAIHALNKQNMYLEGQFVYMRKVPLAK